MLVPKLLGMLIEWYQLVAKVLFFREYIDVQKQALYLSVLEL